LLSPLHVLHTISLIANLFSVNFTRSSKLTDPTGD
jgi:hypothetical protein